MKVIHSFSYTWVYSIINMFSSFSVFPLFRFMLQQHKFTITYRKENSKTYEFRAETEVECNAWIHAIDIARLVFSSSSTVLACL